MVTGWRKLLAVTGSMTSIIAATQAKAADITFAVGEWPPFISEIVPGYGEHAEIVEEVYRRAGKFIQFEFVPWKRSLVKVRDGSYAATFPWYRSESRDQQFLFPHQALDETSIVVFYRKDKLPNGPTGSTYAEMVKHRHSFVAIGSYWSVKALKDLGGNVHVVGSAELAWRMMQRGRIELFPETRRVGLIESVEYLGAQAAANFAYTAPVKTDKMYIMFSRARDDSKINLALWEAHAPDVLRDQ